MLRRAATITSYDIRRGPGKVRLQNIRKLLDTPEHAEGVKESFRIKPVTVGIAQRADPVKVELVVTRIPQVYEDGELELDVLIDGQPWTGRYDPATGQGYLDRQV